MVVALYVDLDGTLFDDRQYVRGGLRNAGQALADRTGLDLTHELLDAYFERGITETTFDTVLRENDLSTDLVPVLVASYHDNDVALSPYPGTDEILDYLSRNYRLGLITGGKNGREKLSRLGLDSYFEEVFVSPEYGSTKRSPDIFETALDALDVSAEEAAYIGDRPALDFPQPNQLGMKTIRVRTGRYADHNPAEEAKPDTVVPSIRELPAVVGRQ